MWSNPFTALWARWKAMSLPWRKHILIGRDLIGNTYWELRVPRGDDPIIRQRRIVRPPPRTHFGDLRVPPAWHQWLRHTRADPPTIEEQQANIARQKRLKILVARADARWEAKPRLAGADVPGQPGEQAVPALMSEIVTGGDVLSGQRQGDTQTLRVRPEQGAPSAQRRAIWDNMQRQENSAGQADPWKRAHGGPGEEWQPQAWDPVAGKRG